VQTAYYKILTRNLILGVGVYQYRKRACVSAGNLRFPPRQSLAGTFERNYCRSVLLFVEHQRFLSHTMQHTGYFLIHATQANFPTVSMVRRKRKGGLKRPSVRKFDHSVPYVLYIAM
jgi:hypothetical protein